MEILGLSSGWKKAECLTHIQEGMSGQEKLYRREGGVTDGHRSIPWKDNDKKEGTRQ